MTFIIEYMSFNIEKLESVNVLDPRTNINAKKEYAILRGGSQTTWKNVVTNSYSNSSVQFSANPPSPEIFVDRKIFYKQPVQITFTGNSSGPNAGLLQSGFDAFRAFPLSQIISSMTVTINNAAVSINLADVIIPLLHYRTPQELRETDYSLTPSMHDQFQNYEDGDMTIRNPLSQYGDSFEMARGGFNYDSLVNTETGAVVTATLCEPLFLSPMYFGHGNDAAFIGVQTMEFNFTFGQNLSRLWSHSSGSNSDITGISVQILQPSLLFTYITPNILEPIPRNAMYPYFEVNRYPTAYGQALASNASAIASTSNIQLGSIPRRMYVFARLANNKQSYTTTDTFLAIENISINWNNFSGLMASADKRSLYNMSRKNGCNLSWEQWSGGPTYVLSGEDNSAYGTVGSVLCIEFGTDIGLRDDEAPGLLGTFQLQMDVTIKNTNQSVDYLANDIMLYIVTVSEGVFNILDNRSISQIGVITKEDIVFAEKSPFVDYHDVEEVQGSGNFFGSLKKLGKKVVNKISSMMPTYQGYGKGKSKKKNTPKRGGILIDDEELFKNFMNNQQAHEENENDEEDQDEDKNDEEETQICYSKKKDEKKKYSGGKVLPRSILKSRLQK